jgi:ferredoxin
MGMKIEVDYDKCTGLGICESLAPDHFEVNESGDLILLKEDVSEDELQAIEEAISGCPTEALRLLKS